MSARQVAAWLPASSGPCWIGWDTVASPIMGTKTGRQVARERVSTYYVDPVLADRR